jgi:hypothetical protein
VKRKANRNPSRRRGDADAVTLLCTGAEAALCVNSKRTGQWKLGRLQLMQPPLNSQGQLLFPQHSRSMRTTSFSYSSATSAISALTAGAK